MSLNLATLIATCAPLIHPVTMRALIDVESHANPYAISINYPARLARSGRVVPALQRQAHSQTEAITWTRWFVGQGYTVSIGIAQINVQRLQWLREEGAAGSEAELFDPCINLRAAQVILLECWTLREEMDAKRDDADRLRRTLSCYNSGDAVTGLRNGYVRRVATSARRMSITPRPRASPLAQILSTPLARKAQPLRSHP